VPATNRVAQLAMFAPAVPRTVVLMCLVAAVLLRSVRSALINFYVMTFQNLQHVTLSLTLRLRQISLWRQVHAVMSCVPNAGITSSEHTALELRTHVSRHFFRFSLSIPLHFSYFSVFLKFPLHNF
jgi:hypothetical protein